MTLQQWQAHPRGHGELLSLVESLAALLAVLHASGRVHRDLKPVRPRLPVPVPVRRRTLGAASLHCHGLLRPSKILPLLPCRPSHSDFTPAAAVFHGDEALPSAQLKTHTMLAHPAGECIAARPERALAAA